SVPYTTLFRSLDDALCGSSTAEVAYATFDNALHDIAVMYSCTNSFTENTVISVPRQKYKTRVSGDLGVAAMLERDDVALCWVNSDSNSWVLKAVTERSHTL